MSRVNLHTLVVAATALLVALVAGACGGSTSPIATTEPPSSLSSLPFSASTASASSNPAIGTATDGQFLPYLPSVMESYTARENELLATDYFDWIPSAFDIFYKESEECSLMQDQICLTKVVERLLDDIDQGLYAAPDWMIDAHHNLSSAVRNLLELHQRAEWGERTAALFFESGLAALTLEASIDEWNLYAAISESEIKGND